MDRDAVIARLRAHAVELKRMGVHHLHLFGSTVRGEAGPDSDVDLFFEYERGNFGLVDLMDVKERASEILGRKADIMTRNSIHKLPRERIEAEAVPATRQRLLKVKPVWHWPLPYFNNSLCTLTNSTS